jgi:hypothetical protein
MDHVRGHFRNNEGSSRGYRGLTDAMHLVGHPWLELNQKRMQIMKGVRSVVMEALPQAFRTENTTINLTNGSNLRYSDLDIAVSGPSSAEVTLVFVYLLGLLSKSMLGGSLARPGLDRVSASLAGLQNLFDVEIYSSSGIIRSKTTSTPRGL